MPAKPSTCTSGEVCVHGTPRTWTEYSYFDGQGDDLGAIQRSFNYWAREDKSFWREFAPKAAVVVGIAVLAVITVATFGTSTPVTGTAALALAGTAGAGTLSITATGELAAAAALAGIALLAKAGKAESGSGSPPQRDYPKGDGTTPPEEGWEWRGPDAPGGERGAWVNPENPRENLHPDFNHGPPIGPHWDWNTPNGPFRLFPDGRILPK